MRRSLLLAVAVLVAAVLGAAVADTARATKPLGHVHGAFTAERMVAPPGGQLALAGIVTIKVNAFDRTLETRPCMLCPTTDSGTVTQTFGPGTLQEGTTETYDVLDVVISGEQAFLLIQEGDSIPFSMTFHDGGSPGNEIVDVANSVGLFPTRDWYQETLLPVSSTRFTGYLTSGSIHVDELPT